jgi:hypothetical protein
MNDNFFFDMSALSSTAAILDTASKVLPLVVAVSGRVGSDTPLICQQSGMRGVIVEETVSTDFIHYFVIITMANVMQLIKYFYFCLTFLFVGRTTLP